MVKFLDEENISYMLTGSIAMHGYTVACSRQDFDFVVQLQPADVPKVEARLRANRDIKTISLFPWS